MFIVWGGALPPALEPAGGERLRLRAFHPLALSRSNISLNPTRGSVAFNIPPRGVD
jgi:hypothetical protein